MPYGLPFEEDPALRGMLETSDEAQQGRLAATRRPQQRKELVLFDRYRGTVEGSDLAVATSK